MKIAQDAKVHAEELGTPLYESCQPLCLQFRSCSTERPYPVQGHCVLAQSPGWFMIPSIEEYREYCTRPRFAACCWYRGTGDSAGWREARGREPSMQMAAWQPPKMLRRSAR